MVILRQSLSDRFMKKEAKLQRYEADVGNVTAFFFYNCFFISYFSNSVVKQKIVLYLLSFRV
jgi:hypothetical protein